MKKLFLILFLFPGCFLHASAPVVKNVHYSQRKDGSLLVDVYYDVYDADKDILEISMLVSDDAGITWDVSCLNVTGDVGHDVLSGNGKHIVWDYNAEHSFTQSDQIAIKIIANDHDGTDTVMDVDGNIYKTVKIGNQWWMAENLRVTHYRNGDSLSFDTDGLNWAALQCGAYCFYDNKISYSENYGFLYNWFAIDDGREIAPDGWHVPTDEDWKQLEMYLGMTRPQADSLLERGNGEGGKLKENEFNHWDVPNIGATNATGFTALPGGYRDYVFGSYFNKGIAAYFWSATAGPLNKAISRMLVFNDDCIYRVSINKEFGFSVRCIQDGSYQIVLDSISVAPQNTTLHNNETRRLTCTALYTDGSNEDVTSKAVWSIVSGDAGTINSQGLFTTDSSKSGMVTVLAEYEGLKAQSRIAVAIEIIP